MRLSKHASLYNQSIHQRKKRLQTMSYLCMYLLIYLFFCLQILSARTMLR